MNSFEISENTFQIIAMFAGMTIAGIVGFKYRSRRAIVLSCAYASFMLGTLFYTLHRGYSPDFLCVGYFMDGFVFISAPADVDEKKQVG